MRRRREREPRVETAWQEEGEREGWGWEGEERGEEAEVAERHGGGRVFLARDGGWCWSGGGGYGGVGGAEFKGSLLDHYPPGGAPETAPGERLMSSGRINERRPLERLQIDAPAVVNKAAWKREGAQQPCTG